MKKAQKASHAVEMAERLHRAALHMLRELRRADEASGLSPPRLSLLSVLAHSDGLSLTRLAEIEQVRLPSMSALVTALEQEHLVKRRPNREDGRGSDIFITAKGRRVFEKARQARLQRLINSLPEDPHPLRNAIEQLEGVVSVLSAGNEA